MARMASTAVGGYFPTPPDVVQRVIGMFAIPETPPKGQSRGGWNMVDPCAGEGAALRAVAETFRKSGDARSFLAEMEANRAKQCRQFGATVVHGDYFLVEAASEFAGLLWLNPPYDTDRDTKRLEEKFLRRAAPVLAPNGILVFIVPGYALAASAHTLAKGFVDLQCWRFPDETFGDFKQVVLVARRVLKPEADPEIVALVQEWANNFADLEPLPKNPVPTLRVPMATQSFPTWQLSLVDLPTVREQFHPWVSDRGELTDLNPPVDLAARFHRVFPVASVPRATHLAAALAAGVFNGARVEPDDPTTGLPPLLVKGVFDKEFRTVEEKRNKDGEKVAEVQVQHPVLQVTVLDLNAGTFHTIRPSVDLPLITGVEGMTLANLLDSYGLSLMRAMRDACPVLHDPKRDPEIEVSTLAQPLFAAQKSVVNTLLRMVREQGRKGAVILGEIGSGKTRCALGASAELGAKRILVLCPPHLLDTWRNETNAVLPGYNVMVLDSITDAETFATIDRPTVGVLSREKAKLGHGWRSVEGSCPKCGAKLDPEIDYAGKRARCENLLRTPRNAAAHWLVDHINDIARIAPNHSILRTLLGWTAYGETRLAKQTEPRPWVGLDPSFVEGLIPAAKDRHLAAWLVWAVPALAQRVADSRQEDNAYDAMCFHKQLLLAVPPNEPVTHKTIQYADYGPKVSEWEAHRQFLYQGPEAGKGSYAWKEYENGKYQGVPRGSRLAFLRLLEMVVSRALFAAVECREPLYQAVAEPRRFPLATWLCHRRRDSYDVLVVDECHEFSSDDSAQSHAKARLEMNPRAYRILLTGSLANGYADSVYNNMFSISEAFQTEFGREGRTRFVDRYGYWKQIVTEKDTEGKVIAFGSQSDRVERSARRAGMAPGILPLFNLEWLLPNAVTLQKEDLRLDLPEPEHSTDVVGLLDEQATNYKYLLTTLLQEIKDSRWEEGRAGKLWGALAHLPSYLDLACSGDYTIRWPENVPGVGGQEIVKVPSMDPSLTLPKEEWMLSTVDRETAAGRPVLVLAWHRDVLSRLLGVLQRRGYSDAIYLDAQEVGTKKRQAWIDRHVVKAGRRVMVVNPVTIQTGLNNLVHFKTQVWMENPACNPHIYRQAQGRIDRIGQTVTPRFTFPLYDGTMQQQAHRLLLHKVGVALGVDGLDPEAALRAAGVEDENFQGLSVGRALYRLLTGE